MTADIGGVGEVTIVNNSNIGSGAIGNGDSNVTTGASDQQLLVDTDAVATALGLSNDGVFPRVNSISGDLTFTDDTSDTFEFSDLGVTFAGDTVNTDTSDSNIFQGTQVAVVNDTANFQVDVEGVNEGDFRSPSSGASSQVAVLGTGSLALDDYDVTTSGFTANFTLRDLGLEASLDSNEVNNGGSDVTGTVSGVQDGRNILVQAFNADGNVVNETTLTDAQITGGADFSLPNAAFDTGDFTVEVTDLASGITTDELSFTVSEAPEGAVDFAEGTTQVPTGDNAEVTVNFGGDVTETTIEIGANREEYGFNFTLTDEDGSGSATFVLDTLVMNESESGAVSAPGDGSSVSFDSNLGAAADRLGQIQLRMAAVSDADEDRAQLVLTERSTDSLTTHIAPQGSLPDDLSDLDADAVESFIQDVQTPSETVAEGDDLVFLVQANGLFSYINESNDNFALGEQGVFFELTQADSGLSNPVTIDANDSAIEGTFVDEDNERIVVVANSEDSAFVDNGVFDVSFGIEGASNPYVENGGDGLDEEVTSQVEVVDPEVSFDVVDGDTYEVTAEDGAQVFGSTNLAPGTGVTVNAAGDFFVTNDTEVTEDGFVATFDFESEVDNLNTDQEFDLNADGGLETAEATGTFADTPEDERQSSTEELESRIDELEEQLNESQSTNEELNDQIDSLNEELETVTSERDDLQNELANAESTIGDLEGQVSDLEGEVSELEGQVSELEGANEDLQTIFDELGVDNVDDALSEIESLNESGSDGEDSDDGGPGFGIAAALVALIAAALLAVRRRD